jgi:uncharacterized protein (DUF736 family)
MMSDFKPRPNSGALFRNTLKQPGERTPDYRVGGEEYSLACWIKVDKNGRKFLSIAAEGVANSASDPL